MSAGRPPSGRALPLEPRERATSRVGRRGVELLLDAQQLVVLGNPVGSRRRASLDLSAVGCDREIGDRRVLGLTGAMRHDSRVAVRLRQCDSIQRFGERSDLVDLDQDRVRRLLLDALRETHRVRHEQVVADDLELVADLAGEVGPAGPVILVQRILDRDKRERRLELLVVRAHLLGRVRLGLEVVDAVLEELACGDIHAERDVGAGLEAGLLDRLDQDLERGAVAGQVGRESTLVAEARWRAPFRGAARAARGRSRLPSAALRGRRMRRSAAA